MGVFYGLLSALCWGVADFGVARLSRRFGVVPALACVQLAGLVGVGTLLMWHQSTPVATASQWWQLCGVGVISLLGTLLLYRAFAIGTLSIVSPITSGFGVVTALLAFWSGERPGQLALVGAAMLMLGIVLVVRFQQDESATGATGVLEAIIAALCFGIVFWALDFVIPGVGKFWALLVLRAFSLAGAALLIAILRPVKMEGIEAASQDIPDSPNPVRNSIWLLALGVATIDSLAWLAFMTGTQKMDTTLVTALASIYSAITVLLACILLRERLARVQWVGVAIILFGVLMVSI